MISVSIAFFMALFFVINGAPNSTVNSQQAIANPDTSYVTSINLNDASQIFQQSTQYSSSYGTVYYLFTAYNVGTGGIVYTLVTHLTANTNNGAWVAGNVPSTGQWSGKSGFSGPYGWVQPGVLVAGSEPFTAYSPDNFQSTGVAATVTFGISSGASDSLYGTTLSTTYNVEYSYNVPMSEIQPLSMTETNASWEYSDNLLATGVQPTATTYTDAAGLSINGPYSEITVWDQGNFAHYWGWFNAFTHYHPITQTNTYTFPS